MSAERGVGCPRFVCDLYRGEQPCSDPDLADERVSGQRVEGVGEYGLQFADPLDQLLAFEDV